TRLSVFAEAPILDYVTASGTDGFTAAMTHSGLNAYSKLWAIRNGERGRGIKIRQFLDLLAKTDGLGGRFAGSSVTVGGKSQRHRLPARLKLTDSLLALLGYYVAEGNSQPGYFIL